MPLLRKRRQIAAKVETTVGTAEALTASEAAFNVFDPDVNPQIDFETREGQGVFSSLPGVPGAEGGQAKFMCEIYGRGSSGGAVPSWASVFLPACGMVDNGSGVFSFFSRPPGTAGVKTVTIGQYIDGFKKLLRGAMGTFDIVLTSGKRAMIEFTFTGVWSAPTDVALLAPTYPTIAPLRFVDAGLLIGGSGGWEPKVSTMRISAGNVVVLREDASDPSGYISAIITDRKPVGTMDPEASLVATQDSYGKWLDRTERAMALTLGSGTNRVDLAAPKLQFTNLQDGERNNIQIDTVTFQLNRSAAAGDDEFSIDFN